MANNVKFEKNEEGIALVTISRPEALNALNSDWNPVSGIL